MTDGSNNLARLDHRVYRVWFEVLFREALKLNGEWRSGIDAEADEDEVAVFARYAVHVAPVVAIESSLPYAEHLIIELLREHSGLNAPVFLPSLLSGVWQENSNKPADARTPLVLSFQEANDLGDSLAVVHGIETTDNPVLIGCDHFSQVPAEFQRLIDIRLSLPQVTAAHFEMIFGLLFGQPLADEDEAETRWRDYVMPTDIQPPLRLNYPPADAAGYIRERVIARLTRMAVEDAPSLDELHGLGEAREIALDLKRDIHLAMSGTIGWDEVDRGLLLVGPPGTGKTTLARALAKDCGVKFIVASATSWQSSEGLGAHLVAIRTTFEEARRFSPSILFIDEIDSLGNRELLTGQSMTYQATVTNYVLEQLDGFAGRGEVVVLGATNYEDMVDPALRRAGRLDQVVHVPYPTVRALTSIYAHHLKDHAASGRLDDDVDLALLARLTFGLTGADVEFFVRGAARRARKRRGRIRLDDLVAEIMRRPRSEGDALPFDDDSMYRLAVHESGHVVMRQLGKSRGAEINYVSIAPRSDGRVGYVSAFDDERVSMTRDDFIHEIRILLAGRAAEEVIMGADNISDLAGNYGPVSDLAQAARLLKYMHCTTGLTDDPGLLWLSAAPDRAHTQVLDESMEAGLQEIYRSAVDILSASSSRIERIADHLVRHQELDAAELQQLLD